MTVCKLREIAEKRGITLNKIATKMSINPSRIYEIADGVNSNPGLQRMKEIKTTIEELSGNPIDICEIWPDLKAVA